MLALLARPARRRPRRFARRHRARLCPARPRDRRARQWLCRCLLRAARGGGGRPTPIPRTLDQLAAATAALQQRVERIATRARSLDARRKAFLAVAAQRRRPAPAPAPGRHPDLRRGGAGDVRGRAPAAAAQPATIRSSPASSSSSPAKARSPTGSMPSRTGSSFPPDRLEAVMRAAIAECRRRTLAHIPLPRGRGVHARIRHPPELVGL